jgi:phage gp45-like
LGGGAALPYSIIDARPSALASQFFSNPPVTNELADPCSACLGNLPGCSQPLFSNGIQRVFIDGTLIFDQDFCFIGPTNLGDTEIYMAPGAEIVVQSGVTLTLDQVVMFSCDQLWESIIVEDGGTLLVNNSLIEDGTRAILAEPNATVKVTNSTFSDNFVGVSTPSGSISASNNTQIELSGNTFETSSEGLKAPFKGQLGFAGIEIWNVAPLVTVESSSANATTFQNLSNGIRSINSNLLVTEASFLNINRGGDFSSGSGIFSNGSSSGARWAIINGLETGTFQNVGVGLQSLNSWNILTKYSMTEIITGADVRSSRYIAINNNVLKPSSRGIVLSQNPGTFALVQDNVVDLLEDEAENAIGIQLAEPGAGSAPWR